MPSRLTGTGLQYISRGTGSRLTGTGLQYISRGTGSRLTGIGLQYIWTPPKLNISSRINTSSNVNSPFIDPVDIKIPRLNTGVLKQPIFSDLNPIGKYWRIYMYASSTPLYASSYNVSLAGLEMAETVGGPNLCTGGTATSLNTLNNNTATYGPARAFDGNDSTYHHPYDGQTASWIQYELTSPKQIVEIRIKPRNDAPIQTPRFLTVAYSNDGVNFIPVDHINLGVTTTTALITKSVSDNRISMYSGPPRFWRTHVLQTFDSNTAQQVYGPQKQEFLINSVDQTSIDATTGVPIALSTYPGTSFRPDFSYDNNSNTRHVNAYSTQIPNNPITSQYLGWIFTTGRWIDTLRVTAVGSGGSTENNLKNFTVDYSWDGLTWTVNRTYSNVPSWSSNEVRSFIVNNEFSLSRISNNQTLQTPSINEFISINRIENGILYDLNILSLINLSRLDQGNLLHSADINSVISLDQLSQIGLIYPSDINTIISLEQLSNTGILLDLTEVIGSYRFNLSRIDSNNIFYIPELTHYRLIEILETINNGSLKNIDQVLNTDGLWFDPDRTIYLVPEIRQILLNEDNRNISVQEAIRRITQIAENRKITINEDIRKILIAEENRIISLSNDN